MRRQASSPPSYHQMKSNKKGAFNNSGLWNYAYDSNSPSVLSNSRAETMSWADRYTKSDDVFACVNLIAEAGSSIPLRVYRRNRELLNHPGAVLLTRPNPIQNGYEFMHFLVGYYCLEGEVFIYIERNNPIDSTIPNRLWAISGSTVSFEEAVPVASYRIRTASTEIEVSASNMVHIKGFNPHNQFRGISPLASLIPSLNMENSAKISNENIFLNGIGASSIVGIAPNNIIAAQKTKEEIEKFQGPQNRHKPMLLMGEGLQVKPLQLTPNEMQFAELDAATTRDVAKVFDIPLQLLAMEGTDTLNLKTYHKIFYQRAVVPKMRKIVQALNQSVISDGEFRLDLSNIEAMKEDMTEQLNQVTLLIQMGADKDIAWQTIFGVPAQPGLFSTDNPADVPADNQGDMNQ